MVDVIINKSGNFFTLRIRPDVANYDYVCNVVLDSLSGHITEYQVIPGQYSSRPRRVSIPLQFFIAKEKTTETGEFFEYFIYFIGMHDKVTSAMTHKNISYTVNDAGSAQRADALARNEVALKNIPFRDRQRELVDIIEHNNCGQIICPTGWGKSFVIASLSKIYPKAKILVTTHINSVLQQLYLNITEQTSDVGIVCAKKKHNTKARIICAGAKSLNNVSADFDFVFADEIHELGTLANYKTFTRFAFAKMFGFSANSTRPDGGQCIMHALFGPILMDVNYQEAVETKSIVQLEVRFLHVNMANNPCLGLERSVARERRGIWANAYRNKLIANVANIHKDEQILITCKTMEHAFMLKKLLPDFTVIYGSAGRFKQLQKRGIISPEEKMLTVDDQMNIKAQFALGNLKKVIATSVWNRGVDFKPLQVLIRADGSNSNIADKQIPGRASRSYEGKNKGLIYDFYDEFDSTFNQKAKQRKKRYEKEGWVVNDIDDLFSLYIPGNSSDGDDSVQSVPF